MIIHDDWVLYQYGEKFKLCYFKVGQKQKLVNPEVKRLIDRYLARDWTLTDYEFDRAYFLYESMRKKREYFQQLSVENRLKENEEEKNERFSQSVYRARATVRELALCNDFEYFCTFTLDEKLQNRFDLEEFRKKFSQFVRNENRKKDKKIKYVLVPEQHQNGAWHMHGLLAGLDDNDLQINEHGYLDWKKYRDRFGFFSCSKIKDKEKCASYVSKYITKDIGTQNVFEQGQHLFFASQGLNRKKILHHEQYEKCPVENFDFENDYVKIKWLTEAEKNMSLQFLESELRVK